MSNSIKVFYDEDGNEYLLYRSFIDANSKPPIEYLTIVKSEAPQQSGEQG